MNNNMFNNLVVVEYYFPIEGKFDDVMNITKMSLSKFKNGIKGLQMAQLLNPKSKNGPIGMLSMWDSKEALSDMMKNMDDSLKEDVANIQAWTSNIEVKMFDGVDGWHQDS